MKRVIAIAAALVLTACSATEPTHPEPTTSQPTPAPASAPNAAPPYPFGTVQQKAPAEANGKVPIVRRINTTKRYVFLTMDDGAVPAPDAPELIRQDATHPVLFLNQKYVKGHEAYFKQLLDTAGATLGDHTVDHPNLRGKPFAFQRKEICDDADDFQRELGVRPALFRPPFGNYDQNTLRAAATCGMRAAVLWTDAVNDGHVQFQTGHALKPGDIVLMHFRKTFTEDYTAFVKEAAKDGLTPVPLADFLG